MKKLGLLAILLVAVFVFYSCEVASPEDVKKQADEALQSGDVETAEEKYSEVLEKEPDDPEANAGLAIVYTFKFFEKFGDVFDKHEEAITEIVKDIEALSTTRLNLADTLKSFALRKILSVFRAEETPSPTEVVEKVFKEVESLQTDFDDLIDILEKVMEHARNVVESDEEFNMKIYPNNFDWDGDGAVESDKPLRFKITFVDGSVQYFDMKQLYEEGMPYFEKQVEMVEIDKSGGDAWFDYGLLRCEVSDELSDCDDYEVEFDENDYIEIDKGDMYALLWAAEYVISHLYTVIIYNLRIPQETVEAIYQAVITNDPTSLLNYFNPDGDATITNEEISSRLGDFLTFRDEGENYLVGLYDAQVNLRKDLVSLVEDIVSDEDGIEEHNITSGDFIDLDESYLESLREEMQKEIDIMTEPYKIPDATPPATLHIYVVKEHPERFSDLKEFLPDFGIESGEASFPDPTFGGILESEWDGKTSAGEAVEMIVGAVLYLINFFFEELDEF